MTIADKLFTDDFIHLLAVMLMHSLWIGLIIALILRIILIWGDKLKAKTKYALAVLAMLIFVVFCSLILIRQFETRHNVADRHTIESPVYTEPNVIEPANNLIVSEPILDNATNSFDLHWFLLWIHKYASWIVTFWMIGVLIFWMKFMGGYVYTVRLRYQQIKPVEKAWLTKLKSLKQKLGITKGIKLLQSGLVKVPLTAGMLKPVILLPVSALSGLSAEMLESILIHELAHIRRNDYFVNIFQSVVEIIFFYHPIVWWISGIIRAERENSCDDVVVETTGNSLVYAKALTSIQETALLHNPKLVMALAGSKNTLLNRINRILNIPNMKTYKLESIIASIMILLGVTLLSFGISHPTENNKKEKNREVIVTTEEPVILTDNTTISDGQISLKDSDSAESVSLKPKPTPTSDQKTMAPKEEKNKEKNKDKKKNKQKSQTYGEEDYQEEYFEELGEDIGEEIEAQIEAGLEELDVDLIVNQAMAGASAGMAEIDLNAIVAEALDGINAGIQEVDINMVVQEIVNGVQAAAYEIDFNAIAEEAARAAKEAEKWHEDNDDGDNENFKGNPEHLQIFDQGLYAWNQWRMQNKKIQPDLTGMSRSEANIPGIDLSNTILTGANLSEANLAGANLRDCQMMGINLKEANLLGIQLKGANLTGANLKEVNLPGYDFSQIILTGINLKEANLKGSNFQGVTLEGANLKEASLTGSNFQDARLPGVNLKEAELTGSNFQNADLRGVNMAEAGITGANFQNADLRNADLSEAEITGANFQNALINGATLFPPEFNKANRGVRYEE